MRVSGKGNRIPLSFPLPRRHHPPPSVSPSPFFFPPAPGGHSTRHFLKVSLKARDGARPISGSARATRGKTNPRGGGQTTQDTARGQGQEPALRRVAPQPMVSLVGVAVRHCWTGLSSSRTREGVGRRRGRSLAGLGSSPASVDSGWREGAYRHRPGIAGFKHSISSVSQLAVFQPAGVQGGAEPGVRCA